MHFSNSLLLAIAAQSAHAHWFVKCVTKAGESCNVGVEGAHMAPYVDDHPAGTDWPRTTPCDAATDERAQCGPSGAPGDDVEPIRVQAGEELTAWFAHTARTDDYDRRIHSNHHGYCQAYLTPFSQASGQGKWTKIFSRGHISNGDDKRAIWADPSNTDSDSQFVGWWAVDELRMNGGKFTFNIPQGTPSGKYILRPELLTNILVNTAVPNAQVYTGCLPIVVGDGPDESATLPAISETVSIPQDYANEEFVTSYNTFADLSRNVPSTPGGDPWTGTGATTTKRTVDGDAGLKKRSRHFHAHFTT